MAVAVVGTYLPRHCGIASFTADLARAVGAAGSQSSLPMVLAVTEPSGQYQYPPEVKFEIRQNVKADYARAAEFVNVSQVGLVSIQHEYGIFGGDDGSFILDFIHALRVPSMVTLHTVLQHPSERQLAIVRHFAARCEALVVMSRVAEQLLVDAYGVARAKVRIIPHGIPVMDECRDQLALKSSLGVANQTVLLTFGLLSPNKGIETVIRALPAVLESFPNLTYFVLGATHPAVLRREGEAYRTLLEQEAERLGVRAHVVFRSEYVPDRELLQYLQAADVFVSPYLNEEQVTSGALSYAMGAGAAVVSTPYWHARELLSEGRGYLFPFKDAAALSKTLLDVLESYEALVHARACARRFREQMSWPSIGNRYVELSRDILQAAGPRSWVSSMPEHAAASAPPELCLDHLIRMTDDTGIIQHARYSVPARRSGYCVDDNARALIVALGADRVRNSAETQALVTTYLSYLFVSQEDDGSFRNLMSYDRVLEDDPPSDDCVGRAIWALGVTASAAEDEGCRRLAREMLERALPHACSLGPRGTALTILGLVALLKVDLGWLEARRMLDVCVAKLRDAYRANAADDWRWFEPTLTYDNAILPLALFTAYGITAERATLRDARESLEFLEETCFENGQLRLVGNTGWHSRGGGKASADEQAIDAAAFVLAFGCAYDITRDHHYLLCMRRAFAWFLGANRLGVSLYDFVTGGCRDGLGISEVNRNQGAESTICFLMSLLQTLQVAEGQLLGASVREAREP